MELFWAAAILGVLVWLGSIPARRYEKRTGKKLGRSGAASAMYAMNEVFQPSAANASLIIQEQQEQRTAMPSADDKPRL